MNYIGYGSRKKKRKKILIVVAIVIFALIYAVGMTLGSESESRVAISEAIEENVRLKQELADKDEIINELNERIKELENAPEPTQAPQEEENSVRQGSPRE